jgi:hypothetical protein
MSCQGEPLAPLGDKYAYYLASRTQLRAPYNFSGSLQLYAEKHQALPTQEKLASYSKIGLPLWGLPELGV